MLHCRLPVLREGCTAQTIVHGGWQRLQRLGFRGPRSTMAACVTPALRDRASSMAAPLDVGNTSAELLNVPLILSAEAARSGC